MNKNSNQLSSWWLADETADIIRSHFFPLLAAYLPFAIPFILSGFVFINTIYFSQSDALPLVCLLMVVTSWIRWLGCLEVQRLVASALGRDVPPWRSIVPAFFRLRFLVTKVWLDQWRWMR